MPLKIRQLKSSLSKAGFGYRSAKGSHVYWTHPALPGLEITMAGHDGDDAKPYQVKMVRQALKYLEEK